MRYNLAARYESSMVIVDCPLNGACECIIRDAPLGAPRSVFIALQVIFVHRYYLSIRIEWQRILT